MGSPTSSLRRFSLTRLVPLATTRIGLSVCWPLKISDLTICSTRVPMAWAASLAVRVESESSTTSMEKPSVCMVRWNLWALEMRCWVIGGFLFSSTCLGSSEFGDMVRDRMFLSWGILHDQKCLCAAGRSVCVREISGEPDSISRLELHFLSLWPKADITLKAEDEFLRARKMSERAIGHLRGKLQFVD